MLAATLSACDRDTVCAGDAPGTSPAAYDRLAAELARAARAATPTPWRTGARERKLTLDDLRSAAAGSVSTSTRARSSSGP